MGHQQRRCPDTAHAVRRAAAFLLARTARRSSMANSDRRGRNGISRRNLLRAGLNELTSGGIVLDNKEVTSASPDRAVVFQNPSLLPWMSVRENIALGVDRVYPKASRTERADIVSYYLARVGLAD